MKDLMLLVFITLAACFTPIFGKITVNEISPLSLGFFRFGVAAILFYITLKLRRGNLKFEKKDYPRLIFLAILCIPLNQFFFLSGIKLSYASHSGIIYSMNPVYAYIIAVLRKTEKFYYIKLAAILLTVVGIFFVFYENLTQTELASDVLKGDFLLIFAVLTFSSYLSFGKEIIEKYGALKVQAYVFLIGSVMYIPLFIYDLPNLTFANLTMMGVVGYLFLTIIVAYLAYFVWYYALKTIQLSKLTTLSNLAPILTVIFSVIFLSEKISTYFIIGGFITITGVLIMHRATLELN